MAIFEVKNVEIKGISACVPKLNDKIKDIYKWEGVDSFIETTGIAERRRATEEITTADLCFNAAEKLISDLNWEKSEIDLLLFVSQTPDYILPASACMLQDRLNLSKECYALDISLGCSGWVYSLSIITSLMQSGFLKKGILLSGDTLTKACSSEDKSTFPLFGDAGTATALEFSDNSECFKFLMNTDGKGYEVIMIKDGGGRNPFSSKSLEVTYDENNIPPKNINLILDGMSVFSFGISKVPKSVNQLCQSFNIDKESVDLFTFHQANMMMNEMIRKKLKLPENKVPYSLGIFGNTSSASIPLTLVTQEASSLRTKSIKHVVCGFGVGLSWASAWFQTDKIVVPPLLEI